VFLVIVLAGCGGGDDDLLGDGAGLSTDSISGDDSGGTIASQSGEESADDAADDAVGLTAPTLSANPGEAWADVDGERLVYAANGSLYYTCDIGTEQILINFQTADGHDLSIQATSQGDGWLGLLSFKPGGAGNVQYGADLAASGTLVVSENEISYVGTVNRVEDFDVTNAKDVDAGIAVNCTSTGGEPSAVIGDQTYELPASGAQSFDCLVAPDDIEVRINRLAVDGLQLEIDGRQESGNWLGAVVVYDGDARFTSTLDAAGEGLEIDGSSITYRGTFVGTDGAEVDGSVDMTCP
jgi:hypothetical protein